MGAYTSTRVGGVPRTTGGRGRCVGARRGVHVTAQPHAHQSEVWKPGGSWWLQKAPPQWSQVSIALSAQPSHISSPQCTHAVRAVQSQCSASQHSQTKRGTHRSQTRCAQPWQS